MPVISDNLPVIDNEARNRYEIHVQGHVAVLDYIRRGDRIIFSHTGVPKEIQRQGVAAQISKYGLEDARSRGLSVVPRCPYVAAYIEKHPEYADLVVEDS